LPELDDEASLNLNETLAQLFAFLTRRRWWILLPFVGTALASCAFLFLLPDRYTSSAALLVVQQQVPQRYVVPNSTTDVTSALQAMKQEVLSRTQLLRIINDFGLYPKQRTRLAPEQLVELMNHDIDILPTMANPQQKDFDSFKISFTTESALVAQQVTDHLTSLFINEYLRSGTQQATNTTSFLHQQLTEKGKELEVQENRLRDFKLSHIGELPEQQSGNLGILTGLQGQLQNTMASLDRTQQQRVLLQAQLEATRGRRVSAESSIPIGIPGNPNSTQPVSPIDVAQNDLARLEAEKLALQNKGYTSQHPDFMRIQREIAQTEDRLKRLKGATPPREKAQSSTKIMSTPRAVDTTEDPAVAQLKASLEANRMEIENLTKEEKRLKAQIGQYENRINQTPVREQQEARILRDTEMLRQQYTELQKKEQESQLATNLEKQQGGQQFRLIDPPSLPTVPSSPNRSKISFGGAAGGLALGFALALLMEIRDTSFHSEKDLTKHLSPAFVLGIPILPTPLEQRRQRWRNITLWAVASVMLLMVVAAEIYVNKGLAQLSR
jgi:polysaccharide chain length determinant protein (PEP-CTERM system associated)